MDDKERTPTKKQLELKERLDEIIQELYEFENEAEGHVHEMEFNNTGEAIRYLERMVIWW